MARHTRWPGGKDWLPEAFKQLGANTHEYVDPTDKELIAQWIRMFVNRRISAKAMKTALRTYETQLDPEIIFLLNKHEIAHFNDEDLRVTLEPFSRKVWS